MSRSRTSITSFCLGNACRRLVYYSDVWKHVLNDLFTGIFVWITVRQNKKDHLARGWSFLFALINAIPYKSRFGHYT